MNLTQLVYQLVVYDPRISSSLHIDTKHELMSVGAGGGKISIISNVGAAQHDITGFKNKMNLQIKLEKSIARVGENIQLDVQNSVTGADYTLDTIFPYEKLGESTFIIMPDKEITSEIIIIATKDGYESVVQSQTLDAQKILLLDVESFDSDGNILYNTFDLRLDAESYTYTTPYNAEFRPANIMISFPQKYISGNSGYVFDRMIVNGMEYFESVYSVMPVKDQNIRALYDKEILVNVIDAQGGGVYRYGDTVNIAALDKEKLSFLIRDVFSYWEGYAGVNSRESFIATDDISITAVYRQDSSILMGIILVPLLIASVFVLAKRRGNFGWYL